jgi:hypothetical protein
MPTISHDIETGSVLDVGDVGAWVYSLHPETRVWCLSWAVDDGPVQITIPGRDPPPAEWVEAIGNPDWKFGAFNAGFERAITLHILGPRFGYPVPSLDQYVCSQAQALSLALPASLEGVAEVLELKNKKDVTGATVMKKWAKPRKPRKGEDRTQRYWHDDPREFALLSDYCAQDTRAEREAHQRLPPLPPEEQALWLLSERINERGFYTDGALIDAAIRVGDWFAADINTKLAELTEGAITAVAQTPHRLAWLHEHGFTADSTDKTAIGRQLRRKNLPDLLRTVLALRLEGAHAAAAKPLAFKRWRASDGRVHGAFKYHGAHTGRFTSLGVQAQNLKRVDSKFDVEAAVAAVINDPVEELRRKYPRTLDTIGSLARAMICARHGYKLMASDFSGIEARITAWAAGEQRELKQWLKFDATGNPEDEPYFITGTQTFRLPPAQARDIGKTGTLAFGYEGGTGAYRKLAPADDVSTDEEITARKLAWRRAHPMTKRLWGELNRAALRAVSKPGQTFAYRSISFMMEGNFLFMTLPSGRRLNYPFPRIETEMHFGEPSRYIVHKTWKEGRWQDYQFGHGMYGGVWTENAVSAIARDLFAAAMHRVEAHGYAIVHHSHDEIVVETLENFGSEDEFRRLMVELPDWAKDAPIAAKVRSGPRFCATTPPPKAVDSTEAPSKEPRPTLQPATDDIHQAPIPPLDEILETARALMEARQAEVCTAWEANGGGAFSAAPPDGGFVMENTTPPPPPPPPPSQSNRQNGAGFDYSSGEAPLKTTTAPSTIYLYHDADGRRFMRVTRMTNGSKKSFPTAFWSGHRWVSGWPAEVIPYRLPQMLAAPASEPVWITEGEKDAENIAALGLVATTNPGGAGKWQPELAQWFEGKGTGHHPRGQR